MVPGARALPLLAAVAVVAGCGSSATSSVARETPRPKLLTIGGGKRASSKVLSAERAFVRCMSDHGVDDLPEPMADGEIMTPMRDEGSSSLRMGQKACGHLLPGWDSTTPAEKAVMNAKATAYARCMRAHGLPHFPSPNGHGAIDLSAAGFPSVDAPGLAGPASACENLRGGFLFLLKPPRPARTPSPDRSSY
jgi:hypothetical protein